MFLGNGMLFLIRGCRGGNVSATFQMSFDNRYPHLYRIGQAPGLSASEKRTAESYAKRIGDSTGLSCAYNAKTGALFFYYRSPHGGPFAMPFKDLETGLVTKYDDHEVGDYIIVAKLGQLTPEEKEEIAERNRKHQSYQRRVAVEKHTEERAPDMLDYASFRDKKRRGTTKVVSV